MTTFEKTNRNRVRRLPVRGDYTAETIYSIIDTALICHVGFAQDNQPFVIPTLHVRDENSLLLHGATTSRLLRHMEAGHPLCITFTLIDGLVMARAVFHHSMNYRSALIFGHGTLINDPAEKFEAMRVFTEKMMPGRWDDARQPTPNEVKATSIVRVNIDSASAKIRTGPPGDDDEDYALPIWAGLIPLRQEIDAPTNDPVLPDTIPVPDYIHTYRQARRKTE